MSLLQGYCEVIVRQFDSESNWLFAQACMQAKVLYIYIHVHIHTYTDIHIHIHTH